VEVLARVGLAARGLVWLVLGALAFELLRGGDAQADQNGALEALSRTPGGGPFGQVLLGVTVVGMLGYALWSFVEAAYREI
jgi:hypothetical protein